MLNSRSLRRCVDQRASVFIQRALPRIHSKRDLCLLLITRRSSGFVPHAQRASAWTALVLALALLAACDSQKTSRSEQAKALPDVPEVGYVVLHPVKVPVVAELGGRVSAFESADVRPQVSGVIRRRFFNEGAIVKAGQPLYEIDPSLYRASAQQVRANLSRAEANAEAARALAQRYDRLAEVAVISQQDYTNALIASRQAAAEVEQARAAVESAEINLRFTAVPAPITGQIGRSLVTVGALVSANQAEPLAQIQRLDPTFVDMQQSSAQLLTMRKAIAGDGTASSRADVQLALEDGTTYESKGVLEFSEALVNPATGTVTLRARFANSNGLLLPGMFVMTRITHGVHDRAFLVPQVAVTHDASGAAFVYVIGSENRAERRKIAVDRSQGEFWIATGGLAAGERIITEGVGKVSPDDLVNPVPAVAASVADSSARDGRADTVRAAGHL